MTDFSDGWGDMRDEQTLDEPLLTDFLSELKSWGTGPVPVPTAALASLLADADRQSPVAPVPPPVRRKKMLVSKLAALGMAAKVALGVGVAAAAVTTAGIAGALPGPAQNTVAAVVNAVSPLELPRAAAGAVGDTATDDTSDLRDPTTTVALPGADDQTGDDPVAGVTPVNHGACVSAIAHDTSVSGREHGKAVSEAAKSDCGKTDDEMASTTSTSSTTTSVPGDDGTGEISANRGPESSSGQDNSGNDAGQGNGNSGRGSAKK
jgi:hypothetical protein